MILAAISLAAILHRPAPAVTCHSGAVSYKFVGAPGTQFTFAGTRYSVSAKGWIELLSGGEQSYQANGRDLPLNVWPIDDFGTRSVPLPKLTSSSKETTDDTRPAVR
jgi:hypothetical protein